MNYEKYYWLNEESRIFLKRDYLREGITPEERIEEIAQHAEGILGLDGFATKFINYMARGFYSLATPVWTNFGTQKGLPVSCVVGNTWINTRVGGGKLAKDISLGDEVLTHKGRYRKVTNIIPTKNKDDIYELKVSNRLTPLRITGNHPVLTNVGWVNVEDLDINYHLVAINGDVVINADNNTADNADCFINLFNYCPFEYIIVDGRLHKPLVEQKPSHLKSRKNGETVDYISNPYATVLLDEDVSWFLGMWFAEGSVSKRSIKITINAEDEKWVADKWLKIGKEKFGLDGNSYEIKRIRNGKEVKWINCNINSIILANYFKTFGDGCREKTIPQWLIESTKENLSSFLSAFLTGDGSKKKSGNNSVQYPTQNYFYNYIKLA